MQTIKKTPSGIALQVRTSARQTTERKRPDYKAMLAIIDRERALQAEVAKRNGLR